MKTQAAAILLLAAAASADDRPRPEPVQPVETAEAIAARMFTTGGSLMQAQLDHARAQVEADGALAAASFFTVPEPEPTVLRPHDLVTVIVREESSSRSAGSADLEKAYEIDAALKQYLDLDLDNFRLGTKRGNQAVEAEAERAFEGDGRTDRRDSFVTRITAEVLDVKPNGTVVLQAKKKVVHDEDELSILLTGVCRTEDISPDNSVLSTQLHDLTVVKRTKGPVRQATRRGLIPRLVDGLNPF